MTPFGSDSLIAAALWLLASLSAAERRASTAVAHAFSPVTESSSCPSQAAGLALVRARLVTAAMCSANMVCTAALSDAVPSSGLLFNRSSASARSAWIKAMLLTPHELCPSGAQV